MEWQPIETAPKDEAAILLGKYYIDECNGYFGESRWLWVVQGSLDSEDNFLDMFNDEGIPAGHMVLAKAATHWSRLPKAPNA